MKKEEQAFVDFLLSISPNLSFTELIEKSVAEYNEGLRCDFCDGRNVGIIVEPKVLLRCKDCELYSGGITLDMIPRKDYNTVTFLNECTVVEILGALNAV